MSKSITFKKLAMCSLAAGALVAASQGAFAHTRLERPTVSEGTTVGFSQSNKIHNYEVIGHGCPPSTDRRATMGTTILFPNAVSYTPIIGVDQGTGKVFTTNPASDYYSPLAGIGVFIRTGLWEFGNVKVDAKGNIDGYWTGGKAYTQKVSTPIDVDFYTNTVTIAPASCARSVTFELAGADFCDISAPSTTATDEQVLYWSPIPNFEGVPGQPFGTSAGNPTNTNLSPSGVPVGPAYSNYDGYEDAAHTLPGHGWGSPATLTVKRDLVNNPLPQGCTGNRGEGDDVYVYPSAEQINKELPVWSNPDQTGINYWK